MKATDTPPTKDGRIVATFDIIVPDHAAEECSLAGVELLAVMPKPPTTMRRDRNLIVNQPPIAREMLRWINGIKAERQAGAAA